MLWHIGVHILKEANFNIKIKIQPGNKSRTNLIKDVLFEKQMFLVDLDNVGIENDAIDMSDRHCEVTLQQQDCKSYLCHGKWYDEKKVHIQAFPTV